jgi:hypothetical protein
MNETTSTLRWSDGELESFRAKLLPEDVRYYVSEETMAPYRDAPSSISHAQWKELFAKGGYHVNVVVAFGPPALALEELERRLDQDADTFWPVDGVLATLGEAAIPLAIRSMKRAVGNIGNGVYGNQIERALDDIAPIDAAELVDLVAGVLATAASTKAKRKAKAWLVRHHTTATPIIAASLADAAKRKAAQAAAKVLADAGHAIADRKAAKRKPAK